MIAISRSMRPSLVRIAPAPWWWVRLSLRSRPEVPCAPGSARGAPRFHFRCRNIIGLPGPPGAIWMSCRRAIKLPSCMSHCIGHLVAQVLVGVLQGPSAHQVPHDLVGMASSDVPRMRQEHQVQLGLLIQLQDLEDEVPKVQGLIINTKLDRVPLGRQALVQELEVVPLKMLKRRVIQVLQPPQGRQGHFRWLPGFPNVLLGLCRFRIWPGGPPLPSIRSPRVKRRRRPGRRSRRHPSRGPWI